MKQFRVSKLSTYIFLLFLFFLPQQFGPHFWPDFSYVKGIRIDYLSPTLYVSDILLVLLFISSFKEVFSDVQVKSFLFSKLFALLLVVVCIPLLYSVSPANIFFSLFLFFKLLFVGLFAATQIKKQDIIPISVVFVIGGLFQSILSLIQFLRQESIGGIFYFFGERIIFLSSIGAAVINTDQGLILRPYGTFSHPNVLSFYLLTSFILGFYLFKIVTGKVKKYLILAALILVQTGILLSFSRTVILLDMIILASIGLLYGNVKNFRNHSITTLLFFLSLIGFLIFFSNRVSNPENIMSAVIPRLDLIRINFEILKDNTLFGVGLNNYLFSQVELQKNFSSIYLQPVHNIYMLIAAQTGVVGLSIVLWFLYKTAKRLWVLTRTNKNAFSFHFALFTLLFALLFVGIFDHYPLTIIQGQFLTALILCLSWNKNLEDLGLS